VMCTRTTDGEIIVYVKRNLRNENGCGICSWMKQDRISMLKISRCTKI